MFKSTNEHGVGQEMKRSTSLPSSSLPNEATPFLPALLVSSRDPFASGKRHSRQCLPVAKWEKAKLKRLLLCVSQLQHDLAIRPVSTMMQMFETKEEQPMLQQSIEKLTECPVCGHYRKTAWCWILLTVAFIMCIPPAYGYLTMESVCPQLKRQCQLMMALQSPKGAMLGPSLVVFGALLFKVVDCVFRSLQTMQGDIGACCRYWFRKPFYSLYHFHLKQQMPRLQFNDFRQNVGLHDELVMIAVLIGYVTLILVLIVGAHQMADTATGLVVAYAVGKIYCLVVNWTLAGPASMQSIVQVELQNHEPKLFWNRFLETTDTMFCLTSEEAECVLSTIPLETTVPRHVTDIYITDCNFAVQWSEVRGIDEYDDEETDDPDDLENGITNDTMHQPRVDASQHAICEGGREISTLRPCQEGATEHTNLERSPNSSKPGDPPTDGIIGSLKKKISHGQQPLSPKTPKTGDRRRNRASVDAYR